MKAQQYSGSDVSDIYNKVSNGSQNFMERSGSGDSNKQKEYNMKNY